MRNKHGTLKQEVWLAFTEIPAHHREPLRRWLVSHPELGEYNATEFLRSNYKLWLDDVPRKGGLGAKIAARLAQLPQGDETVGIYRRRAKEVNRSYCVVIWDKACSLPYERMVAANSPEQAGAKVVKDANAENGYGPDEDGGFVPVVAYDRTELLRMLVDVDEHESSRDR